MPKTTGILASVIISNFQGMEYLPDCLYHLKRQTYPNYEIIVVDGGSTDGGPEFIQQNHPDIKLIRCGRIGIGAAINIGIRHSSGDVIVFDVNTDENVEPTWLGELIAKLVQYQFKIVCGPVRLIHGTEHIDEAGVMINHAGMVKKINNRKLFDKTRFREQPVDFTGAPAFHRNLLGIIGEIDEEYYIYAEDLDFCHRARLAGYPTRIAPFAISYHHIRGTLGHNTRRLEYYLRRSNIRFHLLYTGCLRLTLVLFYFCVFLPASALAGILVVAGQRRAYAEKFIGRMKAVVWNLISAVATIRERRARQGNRVQNLWTSDSTLP
jgi:GT2 family glycosyltransferase